MEAFSRISTPLSESWTAWVMMSLLLALLIANQRQSGLIRGAWKGLWSTADRTYNESMDFVQFILMHYFCIATPSLALYLYFFSGGQFSGLTFLLIFALWCAVYLVKWGVVYLLRFTFSLEKMLHNVYRHYLESWLVVDMVLWVVLVLMWYGVHPVWTNILLPLVVAFLALVLMFRMAKTFFRSPLSVLYILLYAATLEVLPILFICMTVRQLA